MTAILPARTEIRPVEFSSTQWFLDLDKIAQPIRFSDLLEPEAWQHVSSKMKAGDLIRVRGQGGSFDIMLIVSGAFGGGLAVQPWPVYPSGAAR